MVVRVGLNTPSIESVADSIPSIESVSQSIDNVPSTGELAQSNLNTLAGLQAQTDAIGYEPPDETPQVFYSPSTKKMFVNGLMFDDDDAKTALQSVAKLRDRPLKPSLDIARDWTRVGPKEFGSYIKGIKNPQAGRLAAENFDIGGSNLKLLYGRASQFFGAEKYGQGLVDEAIREIEKNEPFQREFTKIKSGYIQDGDANESHDAIDWFVANLAQQGPNLLESIAAALIGGGVGAVTGANPLSAVGYAVSGVLGKERYKQAVIKAAKKYEKDKKSLTGGERKLIREASSLAGVASIKTPNIFIVDSKGVAKTLRGKPTKTQLDELVAKEGLLGGDGVRGRITQTARDQAIKGGTALGIGTSSYGIGLGDIYGEQREEGQDDRLSAALTAIPYAAMEMLPEFLLAARIFSVKPKKINKTLLEGTDQGGRTSRVLKGFGVGGTLEGTTEVAQESLILANTGQLKLDSPQVQNRLVNSFAAGFFVGGPIGAAANLLSKPSSDVLDRSNSRTEPNDPIDFTDEQPSREEKITGAKERRDALLRQQMKLPASAYSEDTKELEKETTKIVEEEGKKTLKEKGTRDFPIAVISDTKDLEKENTNLLNKLDKEVATTKTEDATKTVLQNPSLLTMSDAKFNSYSPAFPSGPNATEIGITSDDLYFEIKEIRQQNRKKEEETIANILKNNTKKEIKNVEQDLKKATTTTTTPKGKAKLTSADKLNTMLEEISTLDRTALSRYELKSSAKDKGKRRNIASYLAMDQGLTGRTNTEELSKLLAKKIQTKVKLEKDGKINTAQYRNVVADIEAIQRYLSLLVATTGTGVEKRGTEAGEEVAEDTTEINALRAQQQKILDRARAEQEAKKIKVEDYAGPFIVAKSLNSVFVNNVNETINSMAQGPGNIFSGITAQNMPSGVMQSAIEGAISLEYLKPSNKTSSASVVIRGDVQTQDKLSATLRMMAPIVLDAFKTGAVPNDSIVIEDDKGIPLAAAQYSIEDNAISVEMVGGVNSKAVEKIFKEIEKIRESQGKRYTVLESVAGAQKAFKRRGFKVAKKGDEFYSPLETNLFKDNQETETTPSEIVGGEIVGGKILYQLSESFNNRDVQAEIANAELRESFTPMPSGGVNFVQLEGTKEQHERFVQDAGGLIVSFGDDARKAMTQFQIEGDTQDANTKQETAEVVEGKQTRDSRTTTTRDKQETDADTTNIKGTKESVGEKKKGKAKLQVKGKEKSVRKADEKPVEKPADSTGQDKVSAVDKFLRQQKVDKLTRARAKPKDFKKKYKNTQEAWDDIKPLIPGSALIDTVPKPISDSISTAVKESTAIKTEEIRNMFLHMTEQDFKDVGVTPAVYTDMRIAQYEAAILDNDTKQDLLSELVDIGWLDKRSKDYGDITFNERAVTKARNFLNNYFGTTGFYTDNEAAVLDDVIYDRLTTELVEVGEATGLPGIQSGSELRIQEAIAWTKRRGRYQSIIDQRQKKKLPVLSGPAQPLETDQSALSKITIDTQPDYTAIQVHNLIKNQITEALGTTKITQPNRSVPKNKIENGFAKLSDEDKNYGINKEGDLLSDYFTDKGKLILYKTKSAEGMAIFKPITKKNLEQRKTRIETEEKDKAANLKKGEGLAFTNENVAELNEVLDSKLSEQERKEQADVIAFRKAQEAEVIAKDKLKKGEKKLIEYAIVEADNAEGYSVKTLAKAEADELTIEQTFMAGNMKEATAYKRKYLKDLEKLMEPVDPKGQEFLTKQDLSNKDIDNMLEGVDDNPDDTMFFRLDGSVIKNPVPILRVRAIVNKALGKLKLKPKATVVKDKAELESKFPELYERAVAGRQQGDFDTTNFAAFALGDEIVVFANNIKTEEQLKFIVAHETLGHFGLRAFVPDGKLNAVLEDLYNSEGHIKAVADIHIKNGMDKYIAIEEAMANAAATLDVSAIQRMWFAVKNFLNKIGIKFDDDLSRYILSQSRRNLRTGGGSYFNVKQLVSNMQDEYDRATQTRFYTEQVNTSLPASIFAMFGITANSTFGSFNNFKEVVKNKLGLDAPKAIGSALEYLQTLGNISNRSEGLRNIFNIFGMQAKKIKSLERTYETLTQFSTRPNIFNRKYEDDIVVTTTKDYNDLIDSKKSGTEPGTVGATEEELNQVSDLLSYAALFRAKQNGEDSTVAKAPSLRQEVGGGQAVNREAAKELGDMGLVSIEEFLEGIPYDISILQDDTGKLESRKFKPESISPRVYKMYSEIRAAINKSAVDVFESSLESTTFERQDAINNFLKAIGQDSNLTGARETFELIMEKYRQIRQVDATGDKQTNYTSEAKRKSALFIREVNRALFQPLKVEDWQDGNAGVGVKENYRFKDWNDEFKTPEPGAQPIFRFPNNNEYKRIIEGLEELNAIFKTGKEGEAEANTITNTIKSLFALEEATKQIEFNSKRTLMTGYVQFVRRGKYQVETIAFDKDRNRIKLDQQYKNAMPYFQAETEQDAREIQKQVNETFGKNPFVVRDKSGQEIEVTLEASRSVARTASLMSLDQNLSAFLRIADDLQINISVNDRDKIIKGLTDTGSAARQKLPRVGKAGWNKEVVRNQAMFLRAQSHLAGKTYFEHKLNTVLASEDQWLGDRNKLNKLKETLDRVEKFGNEQEKQVARANYDAYANMYRYSAGTTENTADEFTIYEMTGPLANIRTPKQVKPEGRGEDYKQQAKDILGYYASGENIVDSTEDILENSKTGQNLKVLAVSSQLGGSVATAIINSMSMVTHSIPYLATYNPKTGYGGGFGMSASAYHMQKAARQMSDGVRTRLGLTEAGAEQSLANLDWMNKVAGFDPETGEYTADPELAEQLQIQYNISPDEAQAVHRATSDGVLQAAQYNALVGTARGGLTNTTSGMLKKWMSLFSYTEQLNRRATFLAAYRLQKEKLIAANAKEFNVKNITPERIAELNKEIEGEAAKFAEVAVNTSQGEYSMFNRPKISRGPLLNSLMMYKQFVMISIELMKNLGRNERIYFLMLLFFLSGMKGLPFGEDIMDLIDTLVQMFGIKIGTVEKELTMFIDEVAPGTSPLVMRGVLDKVTGATMSTRLGFGDLIPLTGMAKAGSSFEQEVTNFLGPVYAAGEQAVAAVTLFGNYTAGKVGLKADTTRFVDVLRSQPYGGIRAIADAYTYYDDGVITNKQGKVLDKDVHFKEIFFRALNFYPASASYQNDIIRMTKQTGDYVKSIKIKFSEAYVKARISGDRAEMRRIEKDVRAHNRTHRNSEFYLSDWKASANRMYDAWKLPAAERFKKFATKKSRPDIDKLIQAYDM